MKTKRIRKDIELSDGKRVLLICDGEGVPQSIDLETNKDDPDGWQSLSAATVLRLAALIQAEGGPRDVCPDCGPYKPTKENGYACPCEGRKPIPDALLALANT